MLDTPRILETAEQFTAVIPLVVPPAQMQKVMGPAIGEVFATLAAQGIKAAGPVFAFHHRPPSDVFDFEVGVPVATAITPAGRVVSSRLPATTVARAIYAGPYEGLGAAWGELMAWLKQNGHTPASSLWETYVSGPRSSANPAEWRTELSRPLVAVYSGDR